MGDKLVEVLRRFDGNPPLLDARKDFGLGSNSDFEAAFAEAESLELQLRDCVAMKWSKSDRRDRVSQLKRKDALQQQCLFLER